MTENNAASKRKSSPVKKAAVARRPATAKKAAAKPAPAKAAKAAPAPKSGKKQKKEKKAEGKTKVVRDSFTMPQADYEQIAKLKQVCLKAGLHVKKSELLRAGLHALSRLSIAQLERTLVQLEHIKTGRPKKG